MSNLPPHFENPEVCPTFYDGCNCPWEWTYCSDKQPAKRGYYEIACWYPPRLKGGEVRLFRTFSWWNKQPGRLWEDDGAGFVYAWRGINPTEQPTLRQQDKEWWLAKGVNPEYLGMTEP